jgi:hypothetical protein
VVVQFGRELASAQECDLLERAERRVRTKRARFETSLRPFEIKTFRVKFR